MINPQEFIVNQFNALKQQQPLVVNITNYVVMNNTANALLAIGASPIMAHSKDEMEQMLTIANALVINMGTLDKRWIKSMIFAAKVAVDKQLPLVLDPVGCGATDLRTNTARAICDIAQELQQKFIIRGNASEILALAGEQQQTKGVDSTDASDSAVDAAYSLQQQLGCEVVISGETDYVIGKHRFSLKDGHVMMPQITGMGCSHSALTGAFAALNNDTDYSPGLVSTAVMGVAGKLAAQQAKGPGSFQVELLDTLYSLDAETLINELTLAEL